MPILKDFHRHSRHGSLVVTNFFIFLSTYHADLNFFSYLLAELKALGFS